MQVINRAFLIPLIFFVSVACIGADNGDGSEVPSYSEVMLKNALVPGFGFRMLGNDKEAYLYYAALPLNVIGVGLVSAAVFLDGNTPVLEMDQRDGLTTVTGYKNELTPVSKVLLASGIGLSLYGNLLAAYSSYAVHTDYGERYGFPDGITPAEEGRIPLIDVIAAPFRPAHVFNIDVLPIIGLATLGSFSVEDYMAMGDYFKRDQVFFLGYPVTPLAGLGLELLLAGCLVTANAAWEELVYRGVGLQVNGPVYSSLSFGFAHLANMLVPGATVEGTLLQTLFATAFGFYASDKVLRGQDGLERMIALHFWNNVLYTLLKFLADPDSGTGFTIKIRV